MFRRRPFRRRPLFRRRPAPSPPEAPPPPRFPLPPQVRRALVRANRLMEDGQFAEAADILEQLSEKAQRRGTLVRAGDLTLQASRARFAAGDVDAALGRVREALRLFVRGGRPGRVPRVLSRTVAALRERGYDAQADQLEQEVALALEELGLSLEELEQRAPRVTAGYGSLPARCSGCGAPLAPDEVEWHDARTAECPYCGTIAKAA